MKNLPPSIFNDVLGPIMRGPSSSHCAAAWRIGRLCLDLMNDDIDEVEVTYDRNGSLATTHNSQGSDMGLFAGLLGWDATDEDLVNSESALKQKGIKLKLRIEDSNADHPNTYELVLKNRNVSRSIRAISIGGGMIEIIEIDQIPISSKGDFFEILIFSLEESFSGNTIAQINEKVRGVVSFVGKGLLQFKSSNPVDSTVLSEITNIKMVHSASYLRPVLPVVSFDNIEIPFGNCDEMLSHAEGKNNVRLWEMALTYEAKRADASEDVIIEKMKDIVSIMDGAIRTGLAGTKYKDRILGAQSISFKKQMDASVLLDAGMLNRIILYTSAVMETKSSMGLIVAAPTAGSCGTIPGTLIAASEFLDSSNDELIHAMLAAGLIGVFISNQATFSAEIAGCQAECGAASAMAAAGLVSLANGSLEQSITAASLSLQNSLGMICDPIANRVEAPCLGKNIMAASNALSCANMALADYNPLVSFDEVVKTMLEVGKSLPHELRCTALGGLSITESSKKIEKQLKQKT